MKLIKHTRRRNRCKNQQTQNSNKDSSFSPGSFHSLFSGHASSRYNPSGRTLSADYFFPLSLICTPLHNPLSFVDFLLADRQIPACSY